MQSWCNCSFSSWSWSLSFTWCQQYSDYSCSRLWRSDSIENSHASIENLFFAIARSLPQPSWLSVCCTASSYASCYCPNFYPSKILTLIGICVWFMSSSRCFLVWSSGYACLWYFFLFKFIFRTVAVVKYLELPWTYIIMYKQTCTCVLLSGFKTLHPRKVENWRENVPNNSFWVPRDTPIISWWQMPVQNMFRY